MKTNKLIATVLTVIVAYILTNMAFMVNFTELKPRLVEAIIYGNVVCYVTFGVIFALFYKSDSIALFSIIAVSISGIVAHWYFAGNLVEMVGGITIRGWQSSGESVNDAKTLAYILACADIFIAIFGFLLIRRLLHKEDEIIPLVQYSKGLKTY